MAEYTEKKHVDLLDEDKPIANQKFVCISFVSPEKIVEKKEEIGRASCRERV